MELEDLQRALDAIPDPVLEAPTSIDADASGAAGDGDAIPANVTYRVRPGDTLESIAAAHGTTGAAILAANVGLLINDNLIVGQRIQIAGSR